jgi:radical SAM protein with 4Fe4S-binding SPASM domain
MLHYPTRNERELILEALPNNRENLHSCWVKFMKGYKKARISPFLHVHKRDELVVLFHSLSLKKLLGDERLERFTEELAPLPSFDFFYAMGKAHALGDPVRVIDEFMEKNFFEIAERVEEQERKGCPVNRWERFPAPKALFISFTGEDLPHCDYELGAFPKRPQRKTMSPERLGQVLEHWGEQIRNTQEPLTIVLSAGIEGKLDKKLLSSAMERLQEFFSLKEMRGRATRIILLARDEAIDKEAADCISPWDLQVYLTVDNEALRRATGHSEWRKVLKGYGLLKNRIPLCVPVITLDEEMKHWSNFLQFLADEYMTRYIRLQIGAQPSKKNAPAEGAKAALLYLEIFRMMRELEIRETNIGRRLWSFVNESPILVKCPVFGGQLSVDPGGSLGLCPHLLAMGLWKTGDMDDRPAFQKRGKNAFGEGLTPPLYREECKGCSAVGLCGGGCPCKSFLIHGELKPLDPFHCSFMQGIVRGLADELILGCGGKLDAPG